MAVSGTIDATQKALMSGQISSIELVSDAFNEIEREGARAVLFLSELSRIAR